MDLAAAVPLRLDWVSISALLAWARDDDAILKLVGLGFLDLRPLLMIYSTS